MLSAHSSHTGAPPIASAVDVTDGSGSYSTRTSSAASSAWASVSAITSAMGSPT